MLIETKNLVSKKYLNRQLKVFKGNLRLVIRNNKILVTRLGQIVSNQNHYLRIRREDRKKLYKTKLAQRDASLAMFERRLKRKLGGLHIFGTSKNNRRRHLFLVDRKEYARLRAMLRVDGN